MLMSATTSHGMAVPKRTNAATTGTSNGGVSRAAAAPATTRATPTSLASPRRRTSGAAQTPPTIAPAPWIATRTPTKAGRWSRPCPATA